MLSNEKPVDYNEQIGPRTMTSGFRLPQPVPPKNKFHSVAEKYASEAMSISVSSKREQQIATDFGIIAKMKKSTHFNNLAH